jgi:hypothetical protein
MPDYQRSKIYTIRCRTDDTLIYVGSTTQSLAKRWGGHKVDSNRQGNNNRLIYTTINGEFDNWYIELYELYPCNCKEELCKREGEVIRLMGTLNKDIAGRTQQEWTADNKEKVMGYNKKYRENNREKRAEYTRKYIQQKKNNISL